MRHIKQALLGAFALGVVFGGVTGASATDLDAELKSKQLSYTKQEVELRNNKIQDGGTLGISAGGTMIMARSDTNDDIKIRTDTWSGAYIDQEVRMDNNTISGDAAVAVHAGPAAVILN